MLIGEAASLSTVLTDVGSIFTTLMSNVSQVFTLIQTYPIALIPVGITLAFVAVKFTKYVLGM